MMQIITNWQPRPLQCLVDLPANARAEFDYIEEDDGYTPRFFRYKGSWFDAHDAQCIEADSGRAHPMGWALHVHPGSPLAHFDAIASDSFFSGVLWRFGADDTVIVGGYFS